MSAKHLRTGGLSISLSEERGLQSVLKQFFKKCLTMRRSEESDRRDGDHPLTAPKRFPDLPLSPDTFENLGGRELVWRFEGGDIPSDGGALLLKKLEERTGIVRRFAACLEDYRSANRMEHSLLELIAQRVFGLALG